MRYESRKRSKKQKLVDAKRGKPTNVGDPCKKGFGK